MATASQNLDVARLLARQKREELQQNSPVEEYDTPALANARNLRYSPKNERLFSRLHRDSKKQSARSIEGAAKKIVGEPTRFASARLLQIAWTNMNPFTAAASFGLTAFTALGYLNFHLMMRAVAPSTFAPFGTEWTTNAPVLKHVGSVLGILEIILIILLDLLAIFIIIGILAVLLILLDYLSGIEAIPDIGWKIIDWVPSILNYIL